MRTKDEWSESDGKNMAGQEVEFRSSGLAYCCSHWTVVTYWKQAGEIHEH